MLSFRDGTSGSRERLVRLTSGFRTRPARGPDNAAGTHSGRSCTQHPEETRAHTARPGGRAQTRRPEAAPFHHDRGGLRHHPRDTVEAGREEDSRGQLDVVGEAGHRRDTQGGTQADDRPVDPREVGDDARDDTAHHDPQDDEAARATRADEEDADGCTGAAG